MLKFYSLVQIYKLNGGGASSVLKKLLNGGSIKGGANWKLEKWRGRGIISGVSKAFSKTESSGISKFGCHNPLWNSKNK